MSYNPVVTLVDNNGVPISGANPMPSGAGTTTATVAAGTAANTVVKASAGRLGRVLLTTANGAAAVSIFDNATTNTGTVLGFIAASAVAGTVVDFGMPAANGITVSGAATNPAMTISYY